MSRPLDGTGLKRLHREWRRRTGGRVALVLDGVQGPFNVGSIVRTAAAERIEHVWVTSDATAPDADKVGRTALGTERYLTWSRVPDGATAVAEARAAGFRVVALELTATATPLHEADLGDAVALVIGHEDRGVGPATLAAADEVAFVPQLGRVGSLNVATTAAIGIYEARRRSWSP